MSLSLYAIKPRFQALLRPFTAWLAREGATANHVTVAACCGSLALGAALVLPPMPVLFLALPFWFALRMALNAIDGLLAREHGQKSPLGAYLNELSDVIADGALYLPFAFVAPFQAGWVLAVIALSALSEFAGVIGQTLGASRRYDGPMGKSDRALVFSALALWIGLDAPRFGALGFAMPILAVLLIWTIINRVRNGISEARSV